MHGYLKKVISLIISSTLLFNTITPVFADDVEIVEIETNEEFAEDDDVENVEEDIVVDNELIKDNSEIVVENELIEDESNDTSDEIIFDDEIIFGEAMERELPDIDIASPLDLPMEDEIRVKGVLPSSYDARKDGLITAVKDQNPYGTCWAFAATSCVETSLIKNGSYINGVPVNYKTLDLSELEVAHDSWQEADNDNLGNMMRAGRPMLNFDNYGGTYLSAMQAFMRWDGLTLELNNPYSNMESLKASNTGEHHVLEDRYGIHIKDFYGINAADTEAVKAEVYKRGSGWMCYNADTHYPAEKNGKSYQIARYYDSTTTKKPNHGVTIVGWDDNFDKALFSKYGTTPSRNGAFLCKNSWGQQWGVMGGYFWLSYEDYIFTNKSGGVYFYNVDTDTNTEAYQYAGYLDSNSVYTDQQEVYLSATYENKSDSIFRLNTIALRLSEQNSAYSVNAYIYKNSKTNSRLFYEPNNGTYICSVSASYDHGGYHSLDLGREIPIYPNENFSIIYQIFSPDGVYVAYTMLFDQYTNAPYARAAFSTDMSNWGYINGSGWYTGNMPIFAYGTTEGVKSINGATITIPDVESSSAEYYNEKGVHVPFSVSYYGEPLVEGKDYVVTSVTNTENPLPNSYHRINIKGKGQYGGTTFAEYQIKPNDLSDCEITLKSGITPSTTLADIKRNLVVKWVGETKVDVDETDYTFSTSDLSDLNAGDEVTITVYGTRTHVGTNSAKFICKATELNASNVKLAYTTQEFDPEGTVLQYPVKVLYTGGGSEVELIRDENYTVEFVSGSPEEIGQKTVRIIGIKDYITNTPFTLTYNVTKLDLSQGVTVEFDDDVVEYTPNQKVQTYSLHKVINGQGTTIDKKYYTDEISGDGYDVATECTKVGTVNINIIGDDNLTGSFSCSYDVTPKAVSALKLSKLYPSYYYYYMPLQKVEVSDGSVILKEGTDYELVYSGDGIYEEDGIKYTNTGKVTITVKGIGNYTGTQNKSYTVMACDLEETYVTVPETKISYRPNHKEEMFQVPTVVYNEKELKEGIDYTVSYLGSKSGSDKDFIVGEEVIVTITPTGNGNCIGSKTTNYEITPINLKDATVTFPTVTYSPNLTKVKPTVIFDGIELVMGANSRVGDYHVTYSGDYRNVTNAGVNVTIIANTDVTGCQYKGTQTAHYDILPYAFTGDEEVEFTETLEYDVNRDEYQVPTSVKVNFDGNLVTLIEGTDYELSYISDTGNAKDVGNITIAISGKGNYVGRIEKTYSIVPANLSNARLVGLYNLTYKPNMAYEMPVVYYPFEGGTVELDTSDYNVVLTDDDGNVLNGNATAGHINVKVTSNTTCFTGFKTASYMIAKADLSDASLGTLVAERAYEPRTARQLPSVSFIDANGNAVTLGTSDYELESYKLNGENYNGDYDSVGDFVITYKGIGNFSGTKVATYKVTAKDINGATFSSLVEETYQPNIDYQSQDVTDTDILYEGKDFTVVKEKDFSVATSEIAYKVVYTYTGIGNYEGEHKESYIVKKAPTAPNAPTTINTGIKRNKTLSDVAIENPNWIWSSPSTVIAQVVGGNITASAEYDGADKNCYVVTTASVDVYSSACSHPANKVEFITDTEPTCLTDGAGHDFCNECGFTVQDNIPIATLGHDFKNYNSDGNATCLVNGTKTATCERSGCSETKTVEDLGSALGHYFINYTSNGDATCLLDGTKTATCERDGCLVTDTLTDVGSVLGHDFRNYVPNGDVTCVKDETKTATCERDGCLYTDTLNIQGTALGHVFATYVSDHNATCFRNGTKTATCERANCLVTHIVEDVNTKLPHTWDGGTVTIEPAYKKEGTKVYHCTKCDATKSESIPAKQYTPIVSDAYNKNASTAYDVFLVKGGKTTIEELKKVSSDGKAYKAVTSNKKVATISSKGVIQGVKDGTCVITVTKPDKTYEVNVTVTTPKFTEKTLYVNDGETINSGFIGTELKPEFTMAKPSIATVNEEGIITGVAYGKTKLTATCNGKKYTVNVNVLKPEITGKDTVVVGKSLTLKVSKGAKQTTWSVLNGNATITEKGVLKVSNYGDITVQAINNGRAVTKTIKVVEPEITGKTSVKVKKSTTLKVKNGLKNSTWSSSDTSIATVDAKGKVTGKKAGTVTITVVNGSKTLTFSITIVE